MTNGTYISGGLAIDPRQLMLQQQNAHDPYSTNTGFDKFLSLAGTASSMATPVISAAFQKFGGANSMGAAITSTVLSGFASPEVSTAASGSKNMSAVSPSGGASYGLGKNLTMPSAPPGYTASTGSAGSSGSTGSMGSLSGNTDVSQFDSQIDGMMNNNLMFLAVQTKVQNVSQTTQLMSNIYKADSDAKLNAIRNVRS